MQKHLYTPYQKMFLFPSILLNIVLVLWLTYDCIIADHFALFVGQYGGWCSAALGSRLRGAGLAGRPAVPAPRGPPCSPPDRQHHTKGQWEASKLFGF